MNAFFSHGEAEYFLAWRDGRVVGRMTAQINHAFNDHQKKNWGWYGFLEFENDQEVLDGAARRRRRLAARARLRKDGRPGGLRDEQRERDPDRGLRAASHDPSSPGIRPTTSELIEQARDDEGDGPADVEPGGRRPRRCCRDLRVAGKVESEHGIRVRPMSRRNCASELDLFAEVYNSAWAKNWDFVPYSKKDLDALAQEMHLVFDKNSAFIAKRIRHRRGRRDGDDVPGHQRGALPDEGQTAADGLVAVRQQGADLKKVRVGFLGVKPEYQHTGVAAKLYQLHYDAADDAPRPAARWAGSSRRTPR